MLDLALHGDGEPVQCHDIATRQDVPEAYLNQILTLLRRAGLIVSRRGPGGGHHLARPASELRLGEIVEALEGPVGGAWQVQPESGAGSCACTLNEFWRDVGATARQAVDRVTLAELAERARGRAMTYSI